MRFQKLMWRNMMRSTKSQKASVLHYSTSRKHVRCTGKLLKIKSKLIFIPFFFFFFVVQNVIGKIDKEILRIGFRTDPTFLFKKITKKVFTIG